MYFIYHRLISSLELAICSASEIFSLTTSLTSRHVKLLFGLGKSQLRNLLSPRNFSLGMFRPHNFFQSHSLFDLGSFQPRSLLSLGNFQPHSFFSLRNFSTSQLTPPGKLFNLTAYLPLENFSLETLSTSQLFLPGKSLLAGWKAQQSLHFETEESQCLTNLDHPCSH